MDDSMIRSFDAGTGCPSNDPFGKLQAPQFFFSPKVGWEVERVGARYRERLREFYEALVGDDALAHGVEDQLRGAVQVELLHDVAAVGLHRIGA